MPRTAVLLSLDWRRRSDADTLPLKVDLRSSMKDIDISDVSKRSGFPASTLRFYEEKGLIQSIGRRGLKRLFDPSILQRLSLIALGREAGFSLDEIADMFTPDGAPLIEKARLLAKAEELDRSIKRLTALRDGLRHTADCPARSHLECPQFLRILNIVEKRASSVSSRKRKPIRTERRELRGQLLSNSRPTDLPGVQ
jgi:DNA-binding transcriptional MerR regulator